MDILPKKRTYVTTPIYYVNGEPHIGTATTTLLADALARYHKLRGDDPYFLTGTDEWARKVSETAEKAGLPTQEFVDNVSQRFVEAWQYLNIEYDRFIRTTDADHVRVVQTVFERLRAKGDIYLGTYEGWYSVADETFFRDSDVNAETKTAIETGASVIRVQEETYFFRLSNYAARLTQHIGENPQFLQPETRKNEVLAFIEDLRDIAVTQNREGWGIRVPGETGRVIYVWFDALVNYLTATGWPDDPNWQTLWPADVHLMAKEIFTRFHATLWPAMLMALNLPLPQHIVGHGWWTIGGEKGAKSKGNIPYPKDVVAFLMEQSGAPEAICIDALRYYLVRDIRFSADSEFSLEMLATRYNAELANDLGNVLNRVLRAGYFDGTIPTPPTTNDNNSDTVLRDVAIAAVSGYEAALARFDWGAALASAGILVGASNKYLDERAPWNLAKTGDGAGVAAIVYNVLEATRLAALMISPVMPHAAREIAAQLGIADFARTGDWPNESRFGGLVPGTPVGTPTPLFPRIDMKAAFPTKPAQTAKANKKEQNPTMNSTENNTDNTAPAAAAASPEMATEPAMAAVVAEETELITIDDFARVQLRVADIVSAERVEKAKKLLRLQVRIGNEERQIVSGIADVYAPEDLVGRQIVVVYNLQPAVIRGVESKGMLLAASDAEGRAILLQPDKPTESGSKVR